MTKSLKAKHAGTKLPPDPEGMNDNRAKWARSAVRRFQRQTGTDRGTAVSDLLCDLMHFCDREGFDFRAELETATMHYKAETSEVETAA